MRRELNQPNWIEFQREHGPVIAGMREVLAERGTVSNREFATGTRARVDNYRGRKDSSLALHFLWRIGDAMIFRRDGFERVYALTEAVAPPDLLRESDPDVADDYLMTKLVGADGLAPMRTVGNFMRRKVTPAELVAWRQRKLDASDLIEVRVESWRARQLALAADEPLITDLLDGRTPSIWQPLGPTTAEEATFLAPLDPVSARGRATSLFGSSTSGRSTSPSSSGAGVPTRCPCCGAICWWRGSTPEWTERRARSSSTASGWRRSHRRRTKASSRRSVAEWIAWCASSRQVGSTFKPYPNGRSELP
jgi:hypothetical protein